MQLSTLPAARRSSDRMPTRAASTNAYQQGAVLSATPAELVVALYDGARRFLRQATIAMGERNIERTHFSLRRVELIIAYLDGILDDEQGAIPAQLHAIYGFSLSHLNAARMTQDPRKLEEVSDLLGELRESWGQIADADHG